MRIALGATLPVLPHQKHPEKHGMSSKHPVVSIPDVGSMDHAWDILGPWEVDLELLERNDRVPGELAFNSWDEAELRLDAARASVLGVPAVLRLERDSEIERTDAGGGALEWMMEASEAPWSLRCVLWPGDLYLRIEHAEHDEELFRLRARRTREYYAAKYP
jgi:hypothetical protein